jgi:hypothetical protein|tara:strand:+ start:455 stop:1048 length:594 start_codon:yes stop_codon:yes gene_type:complete
MRNLDNVTYNEERDGFIPVPPGSYPAHVTTVKTRKFEDSGKTVYNLTFKVAPEVKDQNVTKLSSDGNGGFTESTDKDGNTLTIKGSFMKGREFRLDKGMWLNPNPSPKDGWMNRNYVTWCESLGIKFENDKDGNTVLAEAEESDILGLPCRVSVKEIGWKNDETGQSGKAMRVVGIEKWHDGYKLSREEVEADDLPF